MTSTGMLLSAPTFLTQLAKTILQSDCAATSLQTYTRSTSPRIMPQGAGAVDRGGKCSDRDGTGDGMSFEQRLGSLLIGSDMW